MTVIPLHSAMVKNPGCVPHMAGAPSKTVVFSDKRGITAELIAETRTVRWNVSTNVPGSKSGAAAQQVVESFLLSQDEFYWVRPAPEPSAEKLPAKK